MSQRAVVVSKLCNNVFNLGVVGLSRTSRFPSLNHSLYDQVWFSLWLYTDICSTLSSVNDELARIDASHFVIECIILHSQVQPHALGRLLRPEVGQAQARRWGQH